MDSRRSQESENRANEFLKQKEIIDENISRFYKSIGTVSRNLRKGDWTYLHRHPEVRAIIRVIVTQAVKNNPENIFAFAAQLFDCNNIQYLVTQINQQLKWINEQVKCTTMSTVEERMLFSESSEVSLQSKEFLCKENYRDNAPCPDPKVTLCPENIKPTCSQSKN